MGPSTFQTIFTIQHIFFIYRLHTNEHALISTHFFLPTIN